MTDELIKRLRGEYSMGPFGKRSFGDFIPPIQNEAADGLEAKDAEIARLRSIGKRLLYHDERGQGVGWQEAMRDLADALDGD